MVNPHDQIEPDTKFLLSSSESPDHMDDMDFTSWNLPNNGPHEMGSQFSEAEVAIVGFLSAYGLE